MKARQLLPIAILFAVTILATVLTGAITPDAHSSQELTLPSQRAVPTVSRPAVAAERVGLTPPSGEAAAAEAARMSVRLDPRLLCDRCSRSVCQTLAQAEGVTGVDLDRQSGVVTVSYTDRLRRDAFESRIRGLPQYRASRAPGISW